MIRIGANVACRPASLAVALVTAAVAAFSPSLGHAACKEWKLHSFAVKQTNGFFVWAHPRDLGGGWFEGGIRQYASKDDGKPDGLTAIEGQMEGSIRGDDFSFTVHWGNGALSEYTGQISPTGFVDGKTQDKLNPGSTAGWSQVPWGGDKLEPAADCPNGVAAPPPTPGSEFASFCDRYANDAVAQATKNKQMKCGLEKGNAERWTLSREAHLEWCLAQDGAAAFKDANGDDIGIPVGSKFLVLEKRANPVWYKLQTKPVGWVWGEDVTLGP